jgi:uncharacterized tellurite resistance protein B-like protein
MEGKQRLYYGLGQLAYLIAKSDGTVQQEEKTKLHQLIMDGITTYDSDFDISSIIFELLEKSAYQSDALFEQAFSNISSSSYYLKDEMKVHFLDTLKKIAEAFPPITEKEAYWLQRITETMQSI